jgi:hypothetical protein
VQLRRGDEAGELDVGAELLEVLDAGQQLGGVEGEARVEAEAGRGGGAAFGAGGRRLRGRGRGRRREEQGEEQGRRRGGGREGRGAGRRRGGAAAVTRSSSWARCRVRRRGGRRRRVASWDGGFRGSNVQQRTQHCYFRLTVEARVQGGRGRLKAACLRNSPRSTLPVLSGSQYQHMML